MPVFRVLREPVERLPVSGCPIGPRLLETLGDINAEVGVALASERARLRRAGYPDDLPLPALWWKPQATRVGRLIAKGETPIG